MPEKATLRRARQARRQGKRPTTQAGEFVREEMEHIKRGKHGARSRKQAVAIGLSKARRAGVKLAAPKSSSKKKRAVAKKKRKPAQRAHGVQKTAKSSARRRSQAIRSVLKRERRPSLRGRKSRRSSGGSRAATSRKRAVTR